MYQVKQEGLAQPFWRRIFDTRIEIRNTDDRKRTCVSQFYGLVCISSTECRTNLYRKFQPKGLTRQKSCFSVNPKRQQKPTMSCSHHCHRGINDSFKLRLNSALNAAYSACRLLSAGPQSLSPVIHATLATALIGNRRHRLMLTSADLCRCTTSENRWTSNGIHWISVSLLTNFYIPSREFR
jgi:hypothetical protein